MRRPFTTAKAYERGITQSMLRWGVRNGRWQRIARGVYLEGGAQPTKLELELAKIIGSHTVVRGLLAGVLYELDGVHFCNQQKLRRHALQPEWVTEVDGYPCVNGLQTLIDLSALLTDLAWEQALESALHKKLVSVTEIESCLDSLGAQRIPGVRRMRRVLALRPLHAPPTESLLETLMVQLMRAEGSLPEPRRQVEVYNQYGRFVARIDLAWPAHGIFIELDGQHHKDQPVYDASRETAIVAATGWLPGRFTWKEVVDTPKTTARRLVELLDQSRLNVTLAS